MLSGRGALSELRGSGVREVEPTVAHWSEALTLLLNNPAELDGMREALTERDLWEYTVPTMVDRIESAYEDAISRRE